MSCPKTRHKDLNLGLNPHYLVWTKKNEYWMEEMNYMYLLHIRQFKEIQAESSAMYLSETKDVEQQN